MLKHLLCALLGQVSSPGGIAGEINILLRLEIPSSICAKLCTVAASNNRVHMPWSLCYCLFAPHICMVLFFMHIPFVVNHTINATPPERLQQHPLLFTTNRTDRTFFVWKLTLARPSWNYVKNTWNYVKNNWVCKIFIKNKQYRTHRHSQGRAQGACSPNV